MTPQVVLQDDESSRRRCRKPSYQTTNWFGSDAAIKVGSDAARKNLYGLILLSLQHNPTGVWKWHWCHYKDIRRHGSHNCSSMSSIKITQVGSDAASRPMRRRIESAVMPRVKSAWCRNQSRQWCRKKDIVWSHTAFISTQECGSGKLATINI
jgi:hypothetical protein